MERELALWLFTADQWRTLAWMVLPTWMLTEVAKRVFMVGLRGAARTRVVWAVAFVLGVGLTGVFWWLADGAGDARFWVVAGCLVGGASILADMVALSRLGAILPWLQKRGGKR